MIFFLASFFLSLPPPPPPPPIRKANSKQGYILLFVFLLFIACHGVILIFFLTNICTYSRQRETVSHFPVHVHLSAATHRRQGVYMCMCSKYTGVYTTWWWRVGGIKKLHLFIYCVCKRWFFFKKKMLHIIFDNLIWTTLKIDFMKIINIYESKLV